MNLETNNDNLSSKKEKIIKSTLKSIELNDFKNFQKPEKFNEDLITNVILADRSNFRRPTHKVKNRAEVRGGGRKPWRQKGTGNARAGSNSSPIWVGGGTVFGPSNERNYKIKINKKAKKIAFNHALIMAIENKKVFISDFEEISKVSTKNFVDFLSKNNIKDKKIIIVSVNENISLSARNLSKVVVTHQSSLYVEQLIGADFIIFSNEQWNLLHERMVL